LIGLKRTSWFSSVGRVFNWTFYFYREIPASTLGFSGGASAVKKPGHFEVRKSSSQVTPY
jgi:hypothetical protein